MKQLSKRYEQELNLAIQQVEANENIGRVKKVILTTIINSEKSGFYAKGEFEEDSRIFNSMASLLDDELLNIAKNSYSKLSWWFYKKPIQRNIALISNAILSNWFALIDETIISINESDESIEEIYLLNHLFNENLLNTQKKEYLNVIYSHWLEQVDIEKAIQSFFKKLLEAGYLKTSFESEIYYQEHWYKRVTIRKHKWRDYLLTETKQKDTLSQ